MLDLKGLNIFVSKGDTGNITVTFTGEDTPPDNTIALVTVKKTADREEHIWEKELTVTNARVVIPLRTVDTDLAYGRYYWDLRLLYDNGDVYTPMKPAEFRVVETIGDVEGGEGS